MDIFENYVKQYDLKNAKIVRKYRQSIRVQHLCELLARNIGFSNEDIKLAKICGLFHDIGRFKQIELYDSFSDKNTFDHGDEGANIFLKQIAPELNLKQNDIDLIYKSIKYHNKFAIGNDVNAKELIFCKLLRDADKIDILYQLSSINGLLHPNDGEISNINDKDFMQKKCLNRKNITTGIEENLTLLAFIWDINFDISKKIIYDNKYYEKIEKILDDNRYDKYFNLIYKSLKEGDKNARVS